MTITIQPVMITVDRSPGENYLTETLHRLQDSTDNSLVGLVLYDSASGGYGRDEFVLNYRSHDPLVCANLNVADALEYAATKGSEFVLFLEDDIDFVNNFFDSVARWLSDHVSSLPTIYPLGANYGEVTDGYNRGETWWSYPVSKFYGTQAFIIRSRDVASCVTYVRDHCYDLHKDGTGYDHLIRDWATSNGITHFVTPCPSFIQHVGTTSIIKSRGSIHTFPSWPGDKWSYTGTVRDTVCVVTPMRNARLHLDTYFKQFVKLRETLVDCHVRLIVAEGDSTDGTRASVIEHATRHGIDITLVNTTHGGKRYHSVEDPIRLRMMSNVMNSAMLLVRGSDSIVMWVMADVVYEISTIVEMLDTVKQHSMGTIVAPLALSHDGSYFWDTWAFRIDGQRFTNNPPYHPQLAEVGLTKLDSAGTCLVMPAQVAKDCRAELLEAVDFCNDARSKGYDIVTSRTWKVHHTLQGTKRLLWLGDIANDTGFGRCTRNVLPELAALGYDIDIIGVNYQGGPHNLPYNLWPARMPDGTYIRGEARLLQLLQLNSFDVLVILGDPRDIDGYMSVVDKSANKPSTIVGWLTVDSENQQAGRLADLDTIITCTGFGHTELVRAIGDIDNPPSMYIVPLGVDSNVFRPSESGRDFLPPELKHKFVIGTVAKNQYRKRLDITIECFAKLVHDHKVDAVLLIHTLQPNIDNYPIDIGAIAKYHDVDGLVMVSSIEADDTYMARFFNALDVYVSTSIGEGFCLPVLEAAACGVHCVVPNHSGFSWAKYALKVDCPNRVVTGPLNVPGYTIGYEVDRGKFAQTLYDCYRIKPRKELVEWARLMSWKSTSTKVANIVDDTVNAVDDAIVDDRMDVAV